jgi:hypothetical protein
LKLQSAFLSCLTLVACATSPRGVPHVPPEEAAWFKVPEALPDAGKQNIPAAMAAAMHLAMDDFLPRDAALPRQASAQALCLAQRQSYDVEAAPGPAGVVWVSISPSPDACRQGGPVLDTGSATYAVDTHQRRILATQEHASAEEASKIQFPASLPAEGLLRLEGNTATAIGLAMDDFLPGNSSPPAGTAPDVACRYRRESYDVSTATTSMGVTLVRFTINDAVCPPPPSATVDPATGLPPLEVTTYAVDIRMMRILTFALDIQRRAPAEARPEPKG